MSNPEAIQPPETVEVSSRETSCDGGGVLGHPLVYLDIGPDNDFVECPYCDRRFVLKKSKK